MADTKHAPHMGYSPDMDGAAHERMYNSFVHFLEVAVMFVAACVVGLAVGGVKGAWMSAIVVIVLAHVAAGIGMFSPAISWRAPIAALGLGVLMLIFY